MKRRILSIGLLTTTACGSGVGATSDPPLPDDATHAASGGAAPRPPVESADAGAAPEVGPPLEPPARRALQALQALVERSDLVSRTLDPQALGAPPGPARILSANRPFEDVADDLGGGSSRGQWPAGIRRLRDESLVLSIPGRACGYASEALHVTAGRSRSLGRFSTASCVGVPIDTSMAWLSPDGRWFRPWEVRDDQVGDLLERVDAPGVTLTPPQCPSGDEPRTWFFAWDRGGAIFSTVHHRCFVRVDLETGRAEEVALPSSTCDLIVGDGDVMAQVDGRWLLACNDGVYARAPGGDSRVLVEGWRWGWRIRDGRVVTNAGTALVVEQEGVEAILWIPTNGAARIDPLPTVNAQLFVLADSRTGQPAVVSVETERTHPERRRARLFSVGPEGPVERLSAPLPDGYLNSIVVGDAAAGPLFIALESEASRAESLSTLHVFRAGSQVVETHSSLEPECSVLPWHGESSLVFWRCHQTSVLDLRGESTRLWPIGQVLTVLTGPGALEVFGIEASAEVSVVDESGRVRTGEASGGAPRFLGTSGGVGAVLRLPPRLDPASPARVELYVPGSAEAVASASTIGEVVGFAGGRIVTLHDDAVTASPWDGGPGTTFAAAGVIPERVRLSDEGGGLAFLLDQTGALSSADR